jgi:phosphohistidine phosphatase
MKKIILVRHSKAEEQASGITDFERSLTGKGKNIAGEIAAIFKEKEKTPGILVSSPAFRALETAIIFAGVFNIKPEKIKINSNIYSRMNLDVIEDILIETGDSTDKITLFGHNPSFSEIAHHLSKGGADYMPKCGVICISFDIDNWAEIKSKTGKIEYYLKP